jgi:hypothetical protein
MEIPDLQSFPPEHPPSPYSIPIVVYSRLDEYYILARLPDGLVLSAVGWLGDEVATKGDVSEDCIDRLVEAYEANKKLSDGSMGPHSCEICSAGCDPVVQWRDRGIRLYGHGHHLIKLGSTVYMCPVLILHYILDHDYKPPSEFVRAVTEGTFLTVDDLFHYRVTVDEWCAMFHQNGREKG